MPPMNLPFTVFDRPIKPVSLVLMNSMLILGWGGFTENGILGTSLWGDVIGVVAFGTAAISVTAFFKRNQRWAEFALIGAFFVWGVRFWALILLNGLSVFWREAVWLSACWMLLAAGSWLLERSDPHVHISSERGSKWNRR